MNTLFALFDHFANQYREADKSRKGMAEICKWWLEIVRNLAVLAALGYVSQKTESTIIKTIFFLSLAAYTFYFLYPIIVMIDVVYPIFKKGSGIIGNLFMLAGWAIASVGIFFGTGTLIQQIIREVAKAQHP